MALRVTFESTIAHLTDEPPGDRFEIPSGRSGPPNRFFLLTFTPKSDDRLVAFEGSEDKTLRLGRVADSSLHKELMGSCSTKTTRTKPSQI